MALRFNIVGGGITGCISAIRLAQQGCDVHLFEASTHLGGVLRDIQNQGRTYFNGCQYLNVGAAWLTDIRKELNVDFADFPHTYSSITQLFGDTTIHNDFAQPVINAKPQMHIAQDYSESLTSRILSYGCYGPPILEWLNGWGSIDDLHANSAFGMQVPRIFFCEDIEHTLAIKSSSPECDQLLGVPRSLLQPDSPIAQASLPVLGFNVFFEEVERLMNQLGVSVHKSTPITPKRGSDGTIEFQCRGNTLSEAWFNWCGNPTPLLIAADVGKLDSPCSRMYCMTADILSKQDIGFRYYQVFSNTSNIVRIFHYELSGAAKITVEGFWRGSENQSFEHCVVSDAMKYLSEVGLEVQLENVQIALQKRYVNFTQTDLAKIELFNNQCANQHILPGAWHIYGRDAKIEFVDKHIKNILN